MCEFFSGILTKKEKILYLNASNSHDEIIKNYKLKEDEDTKTWLRFEITPIDDEHKKTKNKKYWELKIDEKTVPDWYLRNKEHYDSLMYNALWENISSIIERFDIKHETKILKLFERIFRVENKASEEDIVKIDVPFCVDPAHVVLCKAKTERAKRVISRFIDPEIKYKMPKIKSSIKKEDIKKSKYTPKSHYSIDYFINILKIISCMDDHFAITILKDHPSFLECEDFEFILAPRIESE